MTFLFCNLPRWQSVEGRVDEISIRYQSNSGCFGCGSELCEFVSAYFDLDRIVRVKYSKLRFFERTAYRGYVFEVADF